MPSLFASSGQTPVTADEVMRKKQLAELLMKQAATPNQQAMDSNSPLLAALVPLMGAFAAKRAQGKATEAERGLMGQRQAELSKIMAAGQGTPDQTVQTPFVDDQAQFMGQESPAGLVESEQTIPGKPGGRDAMIQAMLASSMPDIQQLGLKGSLEKPQGQWVPMPGPRGSLIQRNTVTGEMKSVVGQANPLEALIAAQFSGGVGGEDPNAPWKNIVDPKKRDEARIRFGAASDARVAKEQEEVGNAGQIIGALDRFLYLNENSSTGAQFRVPGAKAAASAFSDDYAEMQSITDLLTPQMRQGMPGAASDRDVAMFRGATVGLDKPPEANRNIAMGLKIAQQNKIDRANFIANYVTEKGHDRGADAAWKQYLNANPIFDPKAKQGSYQLNQNRVDFQDWMQSGGKPVTGPGVVQRPANNSGGLTPEEQAELEQLRRELAGGR